MLQGTLTWTNELLTENNFHCPMSRIFVFFFFSFFRHEHLKYKIGRIVERENNSNSLSENPFFSVYRKPGYRLCVYVEQIMMFHGVLFDYHCWFWQIRKWLLWIASAARSLHQT